MYRSVRSLVGVCAIIAAALAMGAEKRVLVVQSYHTGYPWVDGINKGIQQGLSGTDATIEYFYMDTKRKPDAKWKEESGKLAMQKVDEFKPQVVITADDNAQTFFATSYNNKEGAPHFVFCGVNAEPGKYGYPASNVTGILERPGFTQLIELIQQVLPNAKKVAFLTDKNETSDPVVTYCKSKPCALDVTYIQPVTFDEWKAAVAQMQTGYDAVIMYNYHTVLKAPGGESTPFLDVIQWTAQNNKLPIFGLMPFDEFKAVSVAGVCESAVEHGLEAAKIAKAILYEGKKASDFPITTAQKGTMFVNKKCAAATNVKIPYKAAKAADEVIE